VRANQDRISRALPRNNATPRAAPTASIRLAVPTLIQESTIQQLIPRRIDGATPNSTSLASSSPQGKELSIQGKGTDSEATVSHDLLLLRRPQRR
jgi:hypothetical protein